jgi:hypothetical protein
MEISIVALVLAGVCWVGSLILSAIYGIRLGGRATLINFKNEIDMVNMLRDIYLEGLYKIQQQQGVKPTDETEIPPPLENFREDV